jgi:glycosyltransferase involved in cell wall biosynthesis
MTVGYVGSLGDRLDWKLISQVIQGCPDVTFVFVGGLDEQTMINQGNWQATRQTVLTSPNVRHIGKVPSDKVANYYWSFAISWIPYLVNHPFNQASCPTKIMDSIASGRPIVSTSVPECCLYPEWIKILDSVEETISFIRQELDYSNKHEDHEKILKQLKFANQNTWQIRAKTLEQLLIQ